MEWCHFFLHHYRKITNVNWKAVIYNYILSNLQKFSFLSLPFSSELSCKYTANDNLNFNANGSLVRQQKCSLSTMFKSYKMSLGLLLSLNEFFYFCFRQIINILMYTNTFTNQQITASILPRLQRILCCEFINQTIDPRGFNLSI